MTAVVGTDPDWRERAACLKAPSVEPFFPHNLRRTTKPVWCSTCPVTFECLEDAFDARLLPGADPGLEWRGGKLITGLAPHITVVRT